jgi:hypothetical protein
MLLAFGIGEVVGLTVGVGSSLGANEQEIPMVGNLGIGEAPVLH